MTDKPKRVRGKRQPKSADTSKISDETLAADMKAGDRELADPVYAEQVRGNVFGEEHASSQSQKPSIDGIEKAMNDGIPVNIGTDGVVTIGIALDPEKDIPLREHMQALIAAGEARGWLAGRAAALALVHAEIGSEEAQQNHQAWVNCCHALIRKISALRLPG